MINLRMKALGLGPHRGENIIITGLFVFIISGFIAIGGLKFSDGLLYVAGLVALVSIMIVAIGIRNVCLEDPR